MVNRLKELLFENRTVRQTVAKNVFWLSAGELGSRVFRAFIIIYAARVLGAAEYGVFSYVMALAGFFTLFSDIGVNPLLTREVAKKPDEAPYYFASTFWIKIALLVFTAILVIFVAPYFSRIEAAKAILPFAALLICFDGLRGLTTAFFRGKEKMELEALVIAATNVTITVFGFIILYFSASAKTLTITYVLSAGAGTLLGVIILKEQFKKVFAFFKKELVPRILKAAWPIAIISIIGVFMLQIDILMLGYFRSAAEVGYYSVGQRVVQLLYLLPMILASSFFPVLSRFVGQQNNEKAKSLMERGMATVFLIAIPLATGGVILGRSIIDFLFGGEYSPSVSAFQILIFTVLLIFPATLIGNYILAYDKQKKLAPNTAIGALCNVIFNAFLIPPFGIVGAATATVSANLIYHSLNWRLAKKINNFYTLRHLPKIIAAVIVMGIFSFALNKFEINVIVNLIISAGIYLGILYLLKENTVNEIKELFKKNKNTILI